MEKLNQMVSAIEMTAAATPAFVVPAPGYARVRAAAEAGSAAAAKAAFRGTHAWSPLVS